MKRLSFIRRALLALLLVGAVVSSGAQPGQAADEVRSEAAVMAAEPLWQEPALDRAESGMEPLRPAAAPPGVVVEVTGPSTVSLGQVFTTSVVVREANDPGIFGGQYRLDFENAYLQGGAGSLQPGAALGTEIVVPVSSVDNAAGHVSLGVSRLGDLPNVTGDVVLGTVSFTVTNPFSSTVISLHDVRLGAKGGVTIPISSTLDLTLSMGSVVTGVEVIGQIELEGRAAGNWDGAEGSVVSTAHAATTSGDGMFHIFGASEGTFDIQAAATGYLRAICPDVPLVAPTTTLSNPAQLLAGDIDGNDVVDIADATAIGVDFGKTGSGLTGDLNDDGTVDILDLILLAANFGRTGPLVWDCQPGSPGPGPGPGGCAPQYVGKIPVGSQPKGIAVDMGRNRVYVGNYGSNDLSVINGATNTVINTVPGLTTPKGVEYDAEHDYIYVTNHSIGQLSVLDASTFGLVTTMTMGLLPHGVGYNPVNNHVYVANYNSNSVSIVDADTLSVTSVITGFDHPTHVAVNGVTGKTYVTQINGALARFNPDDSYINIDLWGSGGAYGVAVDEARNTVYVATIGTYRLVAVDGNTDTVLGWAAVKKMDGTPAPLRMVAVNPKYGTGHMWITTAGGDGGFDKVLFMPKGWTEFFHQPIPAADLIQPLEGIDINTLTDRVYVSGEGENAVAVLGDTEDYCLAPFSDDADGYTIEVFTAPR
jgi:YVTN family beta-propeller protein